MPAQHGSTTSTQPGQNTLTDLESLAAELTARGLQADLRTPGNTLPYLHVHNPAATALNENIYAQADAYWYSWAEKITSTSHPALAADTLTRVLRTTSEQ